MHAVRDDGAYATGVWTNYFPGGDPYIFASPAIADDGTIYLGTYAGKVYAVDADGAVQWTNSINYSMVGSPAIATNGRIFVADSTTGGKLYMLNQDNGATLRTWSGAGQFVGSPMIGSNGWVYIGSSNNLYAFDPASTETQCVWQAAGPIYSSPALGSNGVIYVGGGSNLYAFNAAGGTDSVWNTGAAIKSSPAIAEDGTIYVGSADKNLYAFNRDGSTNWVFPAGGAVNFHSPVLRRDGTVYFADNTNVYAIFGHAQTDQSAWPAYKHDVLRTGNAAFDAAPILQPTNLVARGASSNSSILVSWAGNPNADYYELYRNHLTTNLADAVLVKTLLTTNYLDTNAITAGLICTYWVRVATPVAMSDFSEFARGGIPPLAPTFVTATKANHTNEIIVTWTNSANATNYFIYSNTVPEALSAGLAWITNAMTPEYVDTNITRGLTCYYWVQASNEITGSSGFSDYDYGGTPPCPPTNITTTTNEYRWVDVAWNTNTSLGASMYVVYRNTSNSLAGSSNLAFASDAHYNDTNNQPFVDYYYWIQATNQYGVGEISTNSPAGFRQLAPPLAVTATKGVEPYNKIRVTWQLKAEAVSYVIYRNITNDADTASQISTPITNYIDDYAIERGAKYYYWARSKSGARTSVFSDGDGYVNMGGTPPFPPGNIRTNSASGASVSVTWDAANHATGYEVFRAVSYDPPATPLAAISLPPYADTLALPGQRYYYWVRATNQFGASDLNGVATGYRPLAPPDAVMASAGLSADHLVVTWSVASNASSYELWRGTNSASAAASMLANSVTANTYDDTASVPGRQYYYWVKAKTAQFVSDFSPFDIGWRTLGQVDIGVSDLVFLPLRMAVGAVPSAISFRVTNHGVQNMAAPNTGVGYNVWISGNAVFGDADDQCLGGGDLSLPLTVGNSVIVVLTKAQRDALVLPPVGPGSYYIFVNIQHAAPAQWLDPNLANNTISRNGGCIQVPAGTNQLPVSVMVNDYNGDGYTDQAMYQEATGNWQVWFFGAQGLTKSGYGGVGCQAVPGDYDGDGKTDFAVYRESTGTWQGWFSSIDYATVAINGWGGPGFEPVPADYDGDGKIDPAVYQESTGTWKGWFSSAVYAMESVGGWGGPGFEPVPADYDGDGWADPAVYHEASGTWWAWLSDWAYSQVGRGGWGGPGYRPAVADYDRDGIMDPAVFLASTGSWRGWLSDSGYVEVNVNGWGITGAVAVPGDYDGDGKADPAVYCDSFGLWRLWLSGSGYHPADILAWPGDGFRPVWNN